MKPTPRAQGDRGTGLIATMAAVLVFLCFLLFAVQLLVDLHATTVVTGVGYEGARRVAGRRVDHRDARAVMQARAGAEAEMRELLGDQAARTTFDWSASTADQVVLHIESKNPRFLLPGIQHRLGVDTVDRTLRVRVEQIR